MATPPAPPRIEQAHQTAQSTIESGRPLPFALFVFCFVLFLSLDFMVDALGALTFGVGWVLSILLTWFVTGLASVLFHMVGYKTTWYRRILIFFFPNVTEMILPILPDMTLWLIVYQGFALYENRKRKRTQNKEGEYSDAEITA